MYNKRMRGAFILFEGIDKSGKSTQSKKLKEFLDNKNIKSKYIAFPGNILSLILKKLFIFF